MKLRTTIAVVALLASTLALGGCGDQGDAQAGTTDYGDSQPVSYREQPDDAPDDDVARTDGGKSALQCGVDPSGSRQPVGHVSPDMAKIAE